MSRDSLGSMILSLEDGRVSTIGLVIRESYFRLVWCLYSYDNRKSYSQRLVNTLSDSRVWNEEMSKFHKIRKDCSVENFLFPSSFFILFCQFLSCFCTYLYSLILAVYPNFILFLLGGRLNTNIISIKAGRRNYIIQASSSAFHGTIRTRQRAFLWYSFSSYRRINRKEQLREPSKSVWLNKSYSWTRAIAPPSPCKIKVRSSL